MDDRADSGDPGPAADLEELRTLLLGPEQQQLADLQARLDDPEERAADVAEVLPRVFLQHSQDPRFTAALTPPIEKAITTSVQRNPKPLADALFPVMGPAIRKAVSAGLASMVESLNRTLEQAVSRRSLQWRLEAWRTGKSFAELVLIKTLLYRVEQVFLIERKSGLLLQHVSAAHAAVQDADMVSGMLTAIKDFVQDSFRVESSDSLEALKVGDLSVWIEPGPHAIVAAVIRGSAPASLRGRLQEAVESIHLQFGDVLESFTGDASALAGTQQTLETCLSAEYRADDTAPRSRSTWVIAGLVLLGILVWAGLRWRTAERWSSYLEALRAEPGIVVVASDRTWGGFTVSGLRDPLARDPQELLVDTGLPSDDVHGVWTPYYALDPILVAARAASALRPPPGVTLTVRDGVLSADGAVTLEWVAEAARLAPLVAGVTSLDAAGALSGQIQSLVDAIEGQTLLFISGAARLTSGQEVALGRLAEETRQLEQIAGVTGLRFRVEVVGHTDSDGIEAANVPLSQARADFVRVSIAPAATTFLEVVSRGEGSRQPAVMSENSVDKQRNRRVQITVTRRTGSGE